MQRVTIVFLLPPMGIPATSVKSLSATTDGTTYRQRVSIVFLLSTALIYDGGNPIRVNKRAMIINREWSDNSSTYNVLSEKQHAILMFSTVEPPPSSLSLSLSLSLSNKL